MANPLSKIGMKMADEPEVYRHNDAVKNYNNLFEFDSAGQDSFDWKWSLGRAPEHVTDSIQELKNLLHGVFNRTYDLKKFGSDGLDEILDMAGNSVFMRSQIDKIPEFWHEMMDKTKLQKQGFDEILPEFGELNSKGLDAFLAERTPKDTSRPHTNLNKLLESVGRLTDRTQLDYQPWQLFKNNPNAFPLTGLDESQLDQLVDAPLYHRSKHQPVHKSLDHREEEAAKNRLYKDIYGRVGRRAPGTFSTPDKDFLPELFGSNQHVAFLPNDFRAMNPGMPSQLDTAFRELGPDNIPEAFLMDFMDQPYYELKEPTNASEIARLLRQDNGKTHPAYADNVDRLTHWLNDSEHYDGVLGITKNAADFGNTPNFMSVINPDDFYSVFEGTPAPVRRHLRNHGIDLNNSAQKVNMGEEWDYSVDFFESLLKRLGH